MLAAAFVPGCADGEGPEAHAAFDAPGGQLQPAEPVVVVVSPKRGPQIDTGAEPATLAAAVIEADAGASVALPIASAPRADAGLDMGRPAALDAGAPAALAPVVDAEVSVGVDAAAPSTAVAPSTSSAAPAAPSTAHVQESSKAEGAKVFTPDASKAAPVAHQSVQARTAWGTRVIVVLGSSTAAGVGPQRWDGAWVERYRAHLRQNFPAFEVVNLALGGATTYEMQASDFRPPANRARPNTTHNITHALTFNPDAIIINMPTNDAAARVPVWEQLANYSRVVDLAASRGVPTWVATTQPRNFGDVNQRNDLMSARDAIRGRFGGRSLDFWSSCAQWDGSVQPRCDSGDGTHLNDEAHAMLVQQVINAHIPEFVLSTHP